MKHIQSTHGEDLPNLNFPDVLELSGFSIAEVSQRRQTHLGTFKWGRRF